MAEPCHRCGGSGKEPDWREFGAEVRRARKEQRLGLREVARQAGCSAAYVSDMEYGKRAWVGPKAKQVLEIVMEPLNKEKKE